MCVYNILCAVNLISFQYHLIFFVTSQLSNLFEILSLFADPGSHAWACINGLAITHAPSRTRHDDESEDHNSGDHRLGCSGGPAGSDPTTLPTNRFQPRSWLTRARYARARPVPKPPQRRGWPKPVEEAKPDWEILSLLANKLGKKLGASLDEISARATQELK